MIAWRRSTEYVTRKVKRTPQLERLHELVGGFLFVRDGRKTLALASVDTPEDCTAMGNEAVTSTTRSGAHANDTFRARKATSVKTERRHSQAKGTRELQLGAARREHRRGSWMLAARRSAYRSKGQAFLPGRTGLNPLLRYLRRPGDWETRVFTLPPPAGAWGFEGIVKNVT